MFAIGSKFEPKSALSAEPYLFVSIFWLNKIFALIVCAYRKISSLLPGVENLLFPQQKNELKTLSEIHCLLHLKNYY